MLQRRALMLGAGLGLLLSLALLLQGLWIPLKAQLAYGLMARAFTAGQQAGVPQAPWHWADFKVTGKLTIKGRDIYVLSSASGEALAFGAGQHEEAHAQTGGLVLSGHRDTHFSILQDIRPSQRLALSTLATTTLYEITHAEVIDTRTQQIYQPPTEKLVLITCWPFEALAPGTPLRLVVTATKLPNDI